MSTFIQICKATFLQFLDEEEVCSTPDTVGKAVTSLPKAALIERGHKALLHLLGRLVLLCGVEGRSAQL
ncbi:MAG: hypothetical protein WBM08_07855 [Prochlorococcaceae cyanobacterium]